MYGMRLSCGKVRILGIAAYGTLIASGLAASFSSSIAFAPPVLLFVFSWYLLAGSFPEESPEEGRYSRYVALLSRDRYFYPCIVALTVVLAVALRLYNLTQLDPYTDEYYHLVGALELGLLGCTDYTRAYPLTYVVHLLFDLFDRSLYVARLPGAIAGGLTVIPLYLLARKVSEPVGIIAVLLWATSPWAIGVSRTVREYAIFPLLFLVFVLFVLYAIDRFVDIVNGKSRIKVVDIAILSLIPSFFVYAAVFDPLSSFKFIFLVTVPLFLYSLYRFQEVTDAGRRRRLYCAILFAAGVGGTLVALLLWTSHAAVFPHFNAYWVNLLLSPNANLMQWYYGSGLHVVALPLILGAGLLYAYRTGNSAYLCILLIFAFILYFYSFHFDRYVRPRYLFYILPFYAILLSAGAYSIYVRLSRVFPTTVWRWATVLFCVAFGLAIFNPANAIYAVRYEGHGYVPMTDEYHDRMSGLVQQYGDRIDNSSTVITSMQRAVTWNFGLDVAARNLFRYNYVDEGRFAYVEEVIGQRNEGWMIIDARRNGYWTEGFPARDLEIGGKKVTFLGRTDGWYVYRW